jgi:hypothetical protein
MTKMLSKEKTDFGQECPNLNSNYQHDFIIKAAVLNSLHLFSLKKGTSHEETTQNALSMLPMGWGCSVGSLKEKRCLYNSLRLREAITPFIFLPLVFRSLILSLNFLPFGLILLSEQNILTNGSSTTTSKLLDRKGFHFRT